jgi:D-beta-D-heptose 7-phosphate kinase/D-beta-D-heptose 1-phosphate adenosyltransferase
MNVDKHLTNISKLTNSKVAVVGDIMLDKYLYGSAGRISPEAPVAVVKINHTEFRPGGAANVAMNIAALGSTARLFGVIGDDAAGKELLACLPAEVGENLSVITGFQTITKTRVISRSQQLIRLDREEIANTTPQFLDHLRMKQVFAESNAIILSDYGKGVLSTPDVIIKLAQELKTPILVDPKREDFDAYTGATMITPNLKEFEQVVGACNGFNHLIEKAFKLISICKIECLLITQGDQGMTLVEKSGRVTQLPAVAREVYDVTGAGDTVIACMGAAFAAGIEPPDAAYLANQAAGIAVSRLGAVVVTAADLAHQLQPSNANKTFTGVCTLSQLMELRAQARLRGEKVVFTNGCFDILHPGHVSYLQKARDLGNRLIIAVNTDDSVKRLKGPTRPINSLEDRMAVLAGLGAVDWVVPFAEDTPQQIIDKLLPDVLVKGGDYTLDTIVGAQTVLAHGGQVKVLNFVDNCSTTSIIERIEKSNEESNEEVAV